MLGIGVAVWMSATLGASFLPGTERAAIATDPRTLMFMGIVSVAVGVFTGMLPVLQARRLTLTDDLKSGARAGTYQRSRARVALIVVQGALSVVSPDYFATMGTRIRGRCADCARTSRRQRAAHGNGHVAARRSCGERGPCDSGCACGSQRCIEGGVDEEPMEPTANIVLFGRR
ncbi:MAG: hypothetical protein ACREM1_08055 [Longimicrobiales bacterium]